MDHVPFTRARSKTMTNHDDNGSSPDDLDQIPDETPAGIDRRSFMMRTAMIGAVTVLSGCKPLTPKETAEQASFRAADSTQGQHLRQSRGGAEVQGTGDDHGGGVLQGGAWAIELAHHRAHADHLQFLRALHQAAGGPAGEGHGAQGDAVRQPERHRQGSRYRARDPGGHHRQGTRDDQSALPR